MNNGIRDAPLGKFLCRVRRCTAEKDDTGAEVVHRVGETAVYQLDGSVEA